MGVHKHRDGQWRLRIVLRPGLRVSWAFDLRKDAQELEGTLRAIRQAKRHDLIDFIKDKRDKLGVLHEKIREIGVAQLRIEDLSPPSEGITIGELTDEFLEYIERTTSKSRLDSNFAPSTVSKYRRNLERFIDWLPSKRGTPARSITEGTLADFHAYLVNKPTDSRKISKVGADRIVTPVQSLFSWASDETRRGKGAVKGLRPLRFKKEKYAPGEAKAVLPEELEAIRPHCSPEVWAIVLTTAELGLRISETLFLRVSDVDLDGGFVTVNAHNDRRLKSESAHRSLPISRRLRPVLAASVAAATAVSREHLWSDDWRAKGPSSSADAWRAGYHRLSTRWENACKKAGVKGTLHGLRHAFGARLADAGVPPRDIVAMLGHSSVTTTERYWRSKQDKERKRVVLGLLEEHEGAPAVPPIKKRTGRHGKEEQRRNRGGEPEGVERKPT